MLPKRYEGKKIGLEPVCGRVAVVLKMNKFYIHMYNLYIYKYRLLKHQHFFFLHIERDRDREKERQRDREKMNVAKLIKFHER